TSGVTGFLFRNQHFGRLPGVFPGMSIPRHVHLESRPYGYDPEPSGARDPAGAAPAAEGFPRRTPAGGAGVARTPAERSDRPRRRLRLREHLRDARHRPRPPARPRPDRGGPPGDVPGHRLTRRGAEETPASA